METFPESPSHFFAVPSPSSPPPASPLRPFASPGTSDSSSPASPSSRISSAPAAEAEVAPVHGEGASAAAQTHGAARGRLHVLLAVTGSVAAIKTREVVEELHAEGRRRQVEVELKLIATKSAAHFLEGDVRPSDLILTDEDDWKSWRKKGDPVLHIELRRWADVLVIAPLSANSLAKLAHGLCDNLVTCVARAWSFAKPCVVFPAMNTLMWEHPLTTQQLDTLRGFGVKVVDPVSKTLACGDTGTGALPPPKEVAQAVFQAARGTLSPP
ncbi:flavoprotein [Besnoitia besnoiti]|uniref:Flavoprotein n=1 Tax=Besnoitia besnoiti TaxID=94643 RepID=A0A2A9MLT5_BESBE|nr:flavoprotein [Besnoitia besnoiti]PFH36450.1 flavoprotein [Besnoitia besnoiti]